VCAVVRSRTTDVFPYSPLIFLPSRVPTSPIAKAHTFPLRSLFLFSLDDSPPFAVVTASSPAIHSRTTHSHSSDSSLPRPTFLSGKAACLGSLCSDSLQVLSGTRPHRSNGLHRPAIRLRNREKIGDVSQPVVPSYERALSLGSTNTHHGSTDNAIHVGVHRTIAVSSTIT